MPENISLALPGVPSAVSQARHAVREFLLEHGSPRVDDAELVASELATNAVRHSRSREDGEFDLRLDLKPGSLRLEVSDQGPPTRVAAGAQEPGESGRGLLLVDAIADDWGHEQHQDRAIWWAELWMEEP